MRRRNTLSFDYDYNDEPRADILALWVLRALLTWSSISIQPS